MGTRIVAFIWVEMIRASPRNREREIEKERGLESPERWIIDVGPFNGLLSHSWTEPNRCLLTGIGERNSARGIPTKREIRPLYDIASNPKYQNIEFLFFKDPNLKPSLSWFIQFISRMFFFKRVANSSKTKIVQKQKLGWQTKYRSVSSKNQKVRKTVWIASRKHEALGGIHTCSHGFTKNRRCCAISYSSFALADIYALRLLAPKGSL